MRISNIQSMLCVSGSWRCKSWALPFPEASSGARCHRSLHRDISNYLLPSPFWYVLNNLLAFKGISRDLWKLATRNFVAASSWSKQPRLTLVQGHCGKCQWRGRTWRGRNANKQELCVLDTHSLDSFPSSFSSGSKDILNSKEQTTKFMQNFK